MTLAVFAHDGLAAREAPFEAVVEITGKSGHSRQRSRMARFDPLAVAWVPGTVLSARTSSAIV
jgi:hypothetical protein